MLRNGSIHPFLLVLTGLAVVWLTPYLLLGAILVGFAALFLLRDIFRK